jgi:hypothetical protein
MIPALFPAGQTHGVNHKSDLDNDLIIDAHFDGSGNRLVRYSRLSDPIFTAASVFRLFLLLDQRRIL